MSAMLFFFFFPYRSGRGILLALGSIIVVILLHWFDLI